MAALDPELEFILREAGAGGAAAPSDPFAAQPESLPAPDETRKVRLLLHHTGDLTHAVAAGFRVTAESQTVASGCASLADVERISAAEGVVLVEGPRPLLSELDVSLRESGALPLHQADPQRRGKGVLIGIIDSGIDFSHGSFIRPDGTTRILAIWDQALTPRNSERSPAPFDYGVEYGEADINAALSLREQARRLAEEARGRVRHVDGRGHGTFVAGIAAGNGSVAGSAVRSVSPAVSVEVVGERPAGTYVGVAPEADLLVVAFSLDADSPQVGESPPLVDAIAYLLAKAEELGRPIVLNVSQGDYVGAHDGTTAVERFVDEVFGDDRPRRAIVKSAGNGAIGNLPQSFDEPGFSHASGVVPRGESVEVTFTVVPRDDNHDTIDLWYSGEDEFRVALRQPDGALSASVAPGAADASGVMLCLPNGNRAFVKSLRHWPLNGDNRIHVKLVPGAQEFVNEGRWQLVLTGTRVTDGRFHAWIDRAALPVPRFELPHGNNDCTISIPGTSREIITVGSYISRLIPSDKSAASERVARELAGTLMDTSSRGPTRSQLINPELPHTKPDIAAPGVFIISSRAGSGGKQQYQLVSGTSASAPHVAGAVALLFEEHPELTQRQIKQLLIDHARPDRFTVSPADGWGAGKLNVKAAHDALTDGIHSQPLTAAEAKGEVTMSQPRTKGTEDAAATDNGLLTTAPETFTLSVTGSENRVADEALTISVEVKNNALHSLTARDVNGAIYEVSLLVRKPGSRINAGASSEPPSTENEGEPLGPPDECERCELRDGRLVCFKVICPPLVG